MTITVEMCGRLADVVGPVITISDDAPVYCVADLRDWLARHHPAVAADMHSPRVHACVDNAIVPDSQVIGDGMTIAFFPPLSGG